MKTVASNKIIAVLLTVTCIINVVAGMLLISMSEKSVWTYVLFLSLIMNLIGTVLYLIYQKNTISHAG